MGFCFVFLLINLLSLSQCSILYDSINSHLTLNSNGFTESNENQKNDFLYGTSDNGGIHVQNVGRLNTSTLNGTSAPPVASNENDSNNSSIQDSSIPGHQNHSQEPRYHSATTSTNPQTVRGQTTSPPINQTQLEQPKPPPSPKPTNQIKLLLLDVNYRQTTPDVILYKLEGTNRHVFTAYETYYIKSVVCGNDLLWESKDNKYPIQVIYEESEGPEHNLELVYPEKHPIMLEPKPDTRINQVQSAPLLPQQQLQGLSPNNAPAAKPPSQRPHTLPAPPNKPAPPLVNPTEPVPVTAQNQPSVQLPQSLELDHQLVIQQQLINQLQQQVQQLQLQLIQQLQQQIKELQQQLHEQQQLSQQMFVPPKPDITPVQQVVQSQSQKIGQPLPFAQSAVPQPSNAKTVVLMSDNESESDIDDIQAGSTSLKSGVLVSATENEAGDSSSTNPLTSGTDKYISPKSQSSSTPPLTSSTPPNTNGKSSGIQAAPISRGSSPDSKQSDGQSGGHDSTAKPAANQGGSQVGKPPAGSSPTSSAGTTPGSPNSGNALVSKTGAQTGGSSSGQAARTGTGTAQSSTPPANQQAKSADQGSTVSTATKTLKLFIKNPNDESKTVELDPTKFTPVDPNDVKFVSHKFDDKTKATEVKYKQDSVWKFNTKTNLHPTSVAWHESYKIVLLQFDDSFRFYTKLMDENSWRSRGLGNSKLLDQNKIKLYAKDGGNLKELASDKYAFKDLGFGLEYVFTDNTKCEKLTYDAVSIFMYDTSVYDGGYPKVLYVFGDRSGQVFFGKSAYPLRSPLSVVVNLKDDKVGTNKFNYKKDGKTVTYTAKQGYGFSAFTTKVKADGCCSCCKSKNKLYYIWYAKEGTEYATKIVLNGKGKSDKTVTIHLANGNKRVYKKNGKNKPWNEITSTDNT